MKVFFCLLFMSFSHCYLAADESEPMTIHSGVASYDGEALSLTGQVTIEHPLGIISAKKLMAYPDSSSKQKTKFSLLTLDEEVSIENDSGCLKCQKARLDFIKLEGNFAGSEEQPEVRYEGKGDTPSSPGLLLSCRSMDVKLERTSASKKMRLQIASIIANEAVSASYGEIHLATPHHIEMEQGTLNGKSSVRTLHAPEETTLVYFDKKTNISHKAIVYGSAHLDFFQHHAWLDSPRDPHGAVNTNKQVYLENAMGEMYADHVEIAFNDQSNLHTPKKIYLKGSVKILNRFDGHIQESSTVLQYALADQLEYDPEQEQIYLSADEGKRVLFFDTVNNLQMSAPALKILRKSHDGKASIQGVGDVRFTFLERELNLLQNRFKMSSPTVQSKG